MRNFCQNIYPNSQFRKVSSIYQPHLKNQEHLAAATNQYSVKSYIVRGRKMSLDSTRGIF